jgi:hypothetical protein
MIKGIGHVLYHVGIVVLSAALALSTPTLIRLVGLNSLKVWVHIENEKMYLVAMEVAIAALLILLLHDLSRGWQERRLSRMARAAGLFLVSPARSFLSARRARRLKREQGGAREVLVIGATGFRSLVDPLGDLHDVVRTCREARIMLLDPRGEGARARARSLASPEITPERFREQIRASIGFLKGLRSLQKNVRLKLYPDTPLLKLTILGDYLWLRHYHPGLDVRAMPEFVFRHCRAPGGLYALLHQYFLARWEDGRIPEYDLETDELVYRAGDGVRREPFLAGA